MVCLSIFLCYFDDILVVSETFDELICDLHEVFVRLLNIANQFMRETVKIYFGLLKIQVKFLIN